jgi:hypothetical protein
VLESVVRGDEQDGRAIPTRSQPPVPHPPGRPGRAVVGASGAIFYFLRRKIDPAQTWAATAAMTWPELTTLGLLAVWNLCTYAFVWMSVTPGLGSGGRWS